MTGWFQFVLLDLIDWLVWWGGLLEFVAVESCHRLKLAWANESKNKVGAVIGSRMICCQCRQQIC